MSTLTVTDLTQMQAPLTTIRLGMLGLGTVGGGVYTLLSPHTDIVFNAIAVRNLDKAKAKLGSAAEILTTDVLSVATHAEIDILVEVMGGVDLAYQAIKAALSAKKHVVTANKVVIATYGPELFALAKANGVNLLFEAAVAGGIPIISPLKTSLAANKIEKIAGILNGTTNYILTRMEQACLGFDVALKEAQDKGFAEADPTADVEGHDAACKIAILTALAYGKAVPLDAIYTQGISSVGAQDVSMAEHLGYAIRLIAFSQATETGAVDIRVHPMLVPKTHPLSKIVMENNAIWVSGHAVGDVMFYGKGAGELPTASSVSGDVLLLVNALKHGHSHIPGFDLDWQETATIYPIGETRNSYYIRIETGDQPGVIGHLGQACGDNNVSLKAVLQNEVCEDSEAATIVLLTHEVKESQLQAALKAIEAQPSTRQVHTVLRVFQA